MAPSPDSLDLADLLAPTAPAFTSSTLTFLFTDIEGSTARWETQREAMAGALVRHDALLRGDRCRPRIGPPWALAWRQSRSNLGFCRLSC